jgi:hypothetical protein
MSVLQRWLERFQELREPGPHAYEWCHMHEGGRHDYHVVFSSMIHGNEVGSLPGLVQIMEALKSGSVDFGGRVSFFVGNPEAGRVGKRFLEADLNRVFIDLEDERHEVRRSRQIRPILDSCDVYIDFHQTILKTATPFYINVWREDLGHWARAIAASDAWVTSPPGQAFSPGTRCADEYVRDQGKPSLTIELSQAGFREEAEALAISSMKKTLWLAEQVSAGASILALAQTQPELTFFQTMHREPFATPAHALMPGKFNFCDCTEGERVHGEGSPDIRVPMSGKLLFPKYPERDEDGGALEPMPGELFHVVQQMEDHPMDLWGG